MGSGHQEGREHARQALEKKALFVHYQPVVNLRTGKICGAEAFPRWQRPDGTVRNPSSVSIEYLDKELAIALGEELRRQILQDIKHWQASDHASKFIALTVATGELMQPAICERLVEMAANAGLPPSCFRLQIDVSVVDLERLVYFHDVLKSLRQAGFTLVIDGVKGGSVSEKMLDRAPFQFFKIHRSVVAAYAGDEADSAFLLRLVGVAKQMNFTVSAEGVESEAQLAVLSSLGCEEAQGFLFARPMPRDDFLAHLRCPPGAKAAA